MDNAHKALAVAAMLVMIVSCTAILVSDQSAAAGENDESGNFGPGDVFSWTYTAADKKLVFKYTPTGETGDMPSQGSESAGDGAWMNLAEFVKKVEFKHISGIGSCLLTGFTALTSVSTDTPITSIGGSAFYGCTSLDPSNLIADGLTSIGANAFEGTAMSGSITIPGSVTKIGKSAFENTDISGVTFEAMDGDTPLVIGNYAFSDCQDLEAVVFEDDVPPTLGIKVFKTGPKFSVPVSSESEYESALVGKAGDVAPSINDYVAHIGDTGYVTLQSAIQSAQSGDKVVLDENLILSETVVIDRSITLDGAGHSITSDAIRTVLVDGDNLNVTIEDITIDNTYANAYTIDIQVTGIYILDTESSTINITKTTVKTVATNARGVDVRGTENATEEDEIVHNVTVNITGLTYNASAAQRAINVYAAENVILNIDDSNLLVNYYALNLRNHTKATVTVTNSTIQGWSVLNSYAVDSTVTFTGCDLKGYNNFGYSDSNNYAVFVLDGGSYWDIPPGEAAVNTTLIVENCTITAETANGNLQSVIAYQYQGQNNSAEFNNCTIEAVGTLHDGTKMEPTVYVDGTGNTMKIDGVEIVLPEPTADEYFEVSFYPVATIDGVQYSDLELAIESAEDGDTVTLIRDANIGRIIVNKSITLNLGDNTIHITDDQIGIAFTSGKSSIINGTIVDERSKGNTVSDVYAVFAQGAGVDLTLNVVIQTYHPDADDYNYLLYIRDGADVTMEGGTLSEIAQETTAETTWGAIGVTVLGTPADTDDPTTFTMNGGTIDVSVFGISGNGTVPSEDNDDDFSNTVITVNDGIVTSSSAQAIYHPQAGTLNIAGGEISGLAGIEMRSGTLNMSGGIVKGSTTGITSGPNPGGSTTDGAGIAVIQHTTRQDIDINISGGEVEGYVALFQSNSQGLSEPISNIEMSVTGGTFTGVKADDNSSVMATNVSDFVTGGKFMLRDADGTTSGDKTLNTSNVLPDDREVNDSGIIELAQGTDAKVMLNDSPYGSITDALGAANPGDTITLLENITVTSKIEIVDDGITIDLGGFSITASDDFNQGSQSSDRNLVTVMADNVTIRNGSLVSGPNNTNTLNLYRAQNVVLEGLTLDHSGTTNFNHALVVNGSTVELRGKTFVKQHDTLVSVTAGIDLSMGRGVTEVPSISFDDGAEITFENCGIGIRNSCSDQEVGFDYNGVTYYYDYDGFSLVTPEQDFTQIPDAPDDGTKPNITIDVTPNDANVTVKQGETIVYSGIGDATIELSSGTYQIICEREGYDLYSDTFTVGTDDMPITCDMNATIPEPISKEVTVTVKPAGASITVSSGDNIIRTGTGSVKVIMVFGQQYTVELSMDGYEPASYTFTATVETNSILSYTLSAIEPEDPDTPVYPPIIPGGDDDDVVIPPVYVPSDTSSSDEDTVKIVACAAAAVVAAIMAAFLILGHRRE